MERSLKEIKLPISGYTAKIIGFFTHGEEKRVQLAQFEGGEMEFRGADTVMTGLPLNSMALEADEMLLVGIKEMTNKSGETVEITKDVFDGLPAQDIKVLTSELVKVRAGKSKKK